MIGNSLLRLGNFKITMDAIFSRLGKDRPLVVIKALRMLHHLFVKAPNDFVKLVIAVEMRQNWQLLQMNQVKMPMDPADALVWAQATSHARALRTSLVEYEQGPYYQANADRIKAKKDEALFFSNLETRPKAYTLLLAEYQENAKALSQV